MIPSLTPRTIWQYANNKVSLIVKDLVGLDADEDTIYRVLLSRGAFKWFTVRRKLIKLKIHWKDRLKNYDLAWKTTTNSRQKAYLKGYRAALRECRREIRLLCHSPRWACPDNDRKAQQWLYDYEDHIKQALLAEALEKEPLLPVPEPVSTAQQESLLAISSDEGTPTKAA